MATVFAVDDDTAMLGIYREMLVMMNHRLIAQAADGDEAVEMYRNLESYPDIVLMDYRMPRMNGIAAMLEIRHINPGQCIIFITSDAGAAREAGRLGANTYVLKPFRFDSLSKTIDAVLSGKRRAREPLMQF